MAQQMILLRRLKNLKIFFIEKREECWFHSAEVILFIVMY